jgi:hypothetical protein
MKTKPKITFAGADWKDIDGLATSFTKALKEYGIFVYVDPTTEGSDYCGCVISDVKLTKKQLDAVIKEELGPLFEQNS